jgi:hypothetical protein
VDRLLFTKPTGVTAVNRIVRVPNSWLLRYEQYVQLEENLTSLAVAAQSPLTEITLGAGSEAQPVQARFVTGSYFSVLGVLPALGRLFHADEETSNIDEAVVLDYGAGSGDLAALLQLLAPRSASATGCARS